MTGYLKCTTGNWDYNYVWFDYSYQEAWKFVDETLSGRERARDTYRNSPEGSATFLVSKWNCECDWNKPWSFESTAVFKGYIASTPPPLHKFAYTSVDAATTYRSWRQS